VERVEKRDQLLPISLLDGLTAVVAEAEVHRAFRAGVDRVEHEIHRRGRERPVGGIARDIGLIHLNALGGQSADLAGEHLAQRHREGVKVAVVMVEQRAGQHVRAGDGELEWSARDRGCALAVGEQVERTFAERAGNDTGRLAAESHRVVAGELIRDRTSHD
jgi:hypothetical protein